MKKKVGLIIIIILIVGVLASILFYFKTNENKNIELEKKLDTASRDYFEKYISANDSVNVYTVTLEDLEKAKEENYDLKGLEKCDKTKTFVDITINYKNGKPKKTQIELKC